jgi:hypothetical protein
MQNSGNYNDDETQEKKTLLALDQDDDQDEDNYVDACGGAGGFAPYRRLR